MSDNFIPKVLSLNASERKGKILTECSNCWLPFELPEGEGEIASCSSVVVGIHRVVRYTSDTPELMQYHDGEWSPVHPRGVQFLSAV